MHRPPRLRPRDAPLAVVHLPAHSSKIAIAGSVDFTVIRHATQQIPLDCGRLPRLSQKVLLLVGACLPKPLWTYAGSKESLLDPSLVFGVITRRRGACELPTPSLDPTLAILVRPAAAMLGLVVGRATHRRLRLAHLRRVDPLLKHVAALADSVFLLRR